MQARIFPIGRLASNTQGRPLTTRRGRMNDGSIDLCDERESNGRDAFITQHHSPTHSLHPGVGQAQAPEHPVSQQVHADDEMINERSE